MMHCHFLGRFCIYSSFRWKFVTGVETLSYSQFSISFYLLFSVFFLSRIKKRMFYEGTELPVFIFTVAYYLHCNLERRTWLVKGSLFLKNAPLVSKSLNLCLRFLKRSSCLHGLNKGSILFKLCCSQSLLIIVLTGYPI